MVLPKRCDRPDERRRNLMILRPRYSDDMTAYARSKKLGWHTRSAELSPCVSRYAA
jgi:hypothetical protein